MVNINNASVVLKVAERCNIACTYCYFFFNKDRSYEDRPGVITVPVESALPQFLATAAKQLNLQQVSVGFHGGEPLLLKKARFDKICEDISAAFDEDFDLNFTVQTNGMLVDEDWIELFRKWNVGVGVSLDGTAEMNDVARLDKKGGGTYDRAVEGLVMMQEASKERGDNLAPGILCVVNPTASGREVYRHFVDTLDVNRLDFLMLDEDHDSATPEILAGTEDFMMEALEEWLNDNNPSVHVRTFSNTLISMLSDEAMRAYCQDVQSISSIFTINSDGNLGPDDVIRSIGGEFAREDFNIKQDGLCDYLGGDIAKRIDQAVSNPAKECLSCKWLSLCGGGRPQHRYSQKNGFNNPSIHCETLKKMFSRLEIYVLENGVEPEAYKRRIAMFAVPDKTSFLISTDPTEKMLLQESSA